MTDTSGKVPVKINFLYWEDCPSHERALEMLEEAIAAEGITPDLQIERVDSEEDARRLGFPGSPTIRVNGVDIDETSVGEIGLTCRMYFREDGRISPLPSPEAIAAALRRAVEGSMEAV